MLNGSWVYRAIALAVLCLANEAGAQEPLWPTTPPASVCGNTDLLTGPATPPLGAIIVPAGDNSGFDFTPSGVTYWFAPGVHTLGGSEWGQIAPPNDSTFIGGPSAVLDGGHVNRYAFTQRATNVTIRHLTIRNFVAPLDEGVVNHDAASGWTIEFNTIQGNEGAGLMVGPNNLYRYNCISQNGQYGINACCGTEAAEIQNVVIDHNEIAGNNTGNWEVVRPGCGCTGGAKFWINENVTVTNNYVHDNRGPGLWLDNNNRGFVIEGNYISDNDGQALFIEAGYDARVRYNNFKNNAIVTGRAFQSRGDPFPIPAVYVSENGSPSGYGLTTSPMLISHNNFENNWGGVALWENADRFCSSSGHTHPPHCTIKVDLYDDAACETDVENDIPDTIDKYRCRWSTENVIVEHNDFIIDKAAIGAGCAGDTYCGINGLFSNSGSFVEFPGYEIPWRLTFLQGNRFRNNRYVGDWRFAGFQTTAPNGSRVSWQDWTAPAPAVPPTYSHANRPQTFGQDVGSTFDGPPTPPPPPGGPPPTNDLDAETSTLESGAGQWVPWVSSTIERSPAEAHGGTYSLRVNVTAPHGWGIELRNWPGFASRPGPKTISFWARLGAGPGLAPTLTVQWLDAAYQVLQQDEVGMPTLTAEWLRASGIVDAPLGAVTFLAHVTGTGDAGTYLYLDDFVIGEAPNALDPATATVDATIGHWQTWFSSSVAVDTQQAYRGAGSLRVDVTAPYGWGVQLDNWPGAPVGAGTKRISYRIRSGAATVSNAALRLKWYDADGELLQMSTVPAPLLTAAWQHVVASVVAPSGVTNVHLEFTGWGEVGDVLHVDDVFLVDSSD